MLKRKLIVIEKTIITLQIYGQIIKHSETPLKTLYYK